MKEKVLLIYGGKSVEHDISIITALQTAKNLPSQFDFLMVYISRDGRWWIGENLDDIAIYKDFWTLAKGLRQVTLVAGENVLCVMRRKMRRNKCGNTDGKLGEKLDRASGEELNEKKMLGESAEQNVHKSAEEGERKIGRKNRRGKLRGKKFKKFCDVRAVLNCCHGHVGEDGALQGLCECCGLAQTSANILASALCMDKALMKDVCFAHSISTPEFLVFCQRGDKLDNERDRAKKFACICTKKLGFPLVIKPANLGSSIGISVCKKEEELSAAIELALCFDTKILAEKYVQNLREFNCACFFFKGEFVISSVREVTEKGDIFSFEDKYLSSESKSVEVEKILAQKIKKLTKKVYQIFGLSGVVRVDFLFDNKSKKLYVNEVNTIPGSLAFYLFKDLNFKDIISALIEQAQEEQAQRNKKIKTFESDALSIFENASHACKK